MNKGSFEGAGRGPDPERVRKAIDEEIAHEVAATEFETPAHRGPPPLVESPTYQRSQETEVEVPVPLVKVTKPGKVAPEAPSMAERARMFRERAAQGQASPAVDSQETKAVHVYPERAKELMVAADIEEEFDGSQPLDAEAFADSTNVEGDVVDLVDDSQIVREQNVVDVRREEHESALRAMFGRINKWFRT